jgi:hypothetical protein
MRATHEVELDIPTLPKAARHIFIVPELADKMLLSVSQLCQAGCQVIFHDKAVTVHYGGKVVLKGAMTARSALWQMEVPAEKETEIYYTANAAIHFNTAAEIHGPFVYNATPIAPLGFRVLVHVKPHMRGTWDPKAEDGFYIGQAPKHYRCVTVYITETASTRITDTIAWIPQNTGVPTTSPSNKVIAAIQNVQTTIMGIPKSNSLADRTEEKIQTLQHLTELFASDKDNVGKMRVAAATVPEVPENNAGKLRVASNTAIPTHLPPLPTEPTV